MRRRDPHFFQTITDVGEVISSTTQPAAIYPHEDSWYSFLLEANFYSIAIVRLEGLGEWKIKWPNWE
jgi:hypothetical protein